MSQYVIPAVTAFHVLVGVFWAGSVFVLARNPDFPAERLAYPQIGGAALVILSGGYLWGVTQGAGFGTSQQVLGAGALCALAAFGVLLTGLPAVRQLKAVPESGTAALRGKIAFIQRVAAGLLTITIICMVVARYA